MTHPCSAGRTPRPVFAESQANYVTTGSNNYGKYTNPEVDTAFDTITGGVLPDEERFKLAVGRSRSTWSTTLSELSSSSSRT